MPVQCALLLEVLRFGIALGQGGILSILVVKIYTPLARERQY